MEAKGPGGRRVSMGRDSGPPPCLGPSADLGELQPHLLPPRPFELRLTETEGQGALGRLPSAQQQNPVAHQVRHLELGQSRLSHAKELTRAPEFQVPLGDAESVLSLHQGLQPLGL